MNRIIALGLCVVFGACSAPEDMQPTTPIAEMYFFPETNEVEYTYSHDNAIAQGISSDTTTYRVVVDIDAGNPSWLQKKENGELVTDTLYFFKTRRNHEGVLECLLTPRGSDEVIVALQGEVAVGNTWDANPTGTITAKVERHYDYYRLPGREQEYEDVVVVKYVDSRQPVGNYMLRYFAHGFGLIHERTIIGDETGPTSEVSNLRLLEWKKPLTTIPKTDRWWDAHGRYGIAPNMPLEDLD